MGDPGVLERASDSAMSDAEPVIGVTSGRSTPRGATAPRSSWTRTAAVRSISAGSRPTWRQASSTVSNNGEPPSGSLSNPVYQLFHRSTWRVVIQHARAIEPISNGMSPSRPGQQSHLPMGVEAAVVIDGALPNESSDDRERLFES